LYLRDTHMATTTLVDKDTNSIASSLLSSMPAPCLSADGRYVAFESADGSFVPGDNNRSLDVFVSDMLANTVELVSTRDPALPSSSPNAPSGLIGSSISANPLLAFSSDADDLVLNDNNGYRDVFVRDLVAGSNILISINTNGVSGNGPSTDPSISSDGRFVAFSSRADNLVAGDTNRSQDVFVRNLQTGTTLLASVDATGLSPGSKDSYSPLLNNDGAHLLFRSQAPNLVPGTAGENLFFRDLSTATTYALTTNGASAASMTPDGRYVAFVASNGASSAVYLWDFQTTSRVYTNTVSNVTDLALSPDASRIVYWVTNSLWTDDRVAQTNWPITSLIEATRPGMRFSSDGRFLVYSAGVGPKGVIVTNNQVWLFDFQAGTSLLISQSANTPGPANDSSDSPDISGDGRFVAFRSAATDIVLGDTNSVPDIFLFDRMAGQISLISASRFGSYSADNRSLSPRFSSDNRTLFFETIASDLTSEDFNGWSDVYSWSIDTTALLVPFPLKVSREGQGVRISWQLISGKTYRVQFKQSLDDPNWQDLNGIITVFGSTASFMDSTTSFAHKFYRVNAF